MTLKHSKAPWIASANNWHETVIYDDNGNVVAKQCIYDEYNGIETTEENQSEQEIKAMVDAQIIAAAPDMLEALEECVLAFVGNNGAEGESKAYNTALEAIAKAKGENQ